MRLIAATLIFLIASFPAIAEEQKAPPPVDPNQSVTLTIGELQALLQAEKVQAQAAAIAAKINAQLKPKAAR